MSNLMTLRPLNSSFLGFDRLFDELDRALSMGDQKAPSFPPYNVYRDGKDYIIELALAGFKKSDVTVEHDKKNGVLIIHGDSKNAVPATREAIKQGISARTFIRRFNVADNFEVERATMEDGILSITLKEVLREEDKPLLITVE